MISRWRVANREAAFPKKIDEPLRSGKRAPRLMTKQWLYGYCVPCGQLDKRVEQSRLLFNDFSETFAAYYTIRPRSQASRIVSTGELCASLSLSLTLSPSLSLSLVRECSQTSLLLTGPMTAPSHFLHSELPNFPARCHVLLPPRFHVCATAEALFTSGKKCKSNYPEYTENVNSWVLPFCGKEDWPLFRKGFRGLVFE